MSNPKFYDRAVDTGEVGEDRRPVYRLATYFLYQVDANNTVEREARQDDYDRFPAEYAVYDRSRQPDAEGFPLAAWTGIDAAVRQGLADRGIYTVEKLAETNMAKAPAEMREAQERAKTFLQRTSQDGPKLAARIEELQDENLTLLEQIGDMKSAINDLKNDTEIPVLTRRVSDLEGQLATACEENGKLSAAVKEREEALQAQGERIDALTKDLAAAKASAKK